MTIIFLTSGTTWTVPGDWTSSNNTIDVYGGGGGGGNAAGDAAGGGGGGEFRRLTNVTLTPGASISYSIGAGGSATIAGGDTNFNSSAAIAKGGGAGSGSTGVGGAGGTAGTGGTGSNGGSGGSPGGTPNGGGAGGGAGGPNGAGANGGSGFYAGSGGGAADGGLVGNNPTGDLGSPGHVGASGGTAFDSTLGGSGGTVGSPGSGGVGSHGSGGGGGASSSVGGIPAGNGGNGGSGIAFIQTSDSSLGGPGGGGGGGGGRASGATVNGGVGGNGGLFGGGGGGGGWTSGATLGTGGSGANGAIIITYNVTTSASATLSKTLSNDTLSATATDSISTTLSKTLSNDTLSATAIDSISATLSKTLLNDTLSATVIDSINATLSKTLSNDTISATLLSVDSEILSVTLGNLTISSTIANGIRLVLSKTLSNLTLISNNVVINKASLFQTLDDLSINAVANDAKIINTIDGPQSSVTLIADDCCPPSICNIDLNSFICSFFAYLPKGPLWDYWKRLKIEQLNSHHLVTDDLIENPNCLTIIDHAAYTAENLYYILRNILQTVVFESDPITAFYTRQKWLDNYGWIDCFSGPISNSKLSTPTPYQAMCDALLPASLCEAGDFAQMSGNSSLPFSNPIIDIETLVKEACPPNLKASVEHALLISLARAQLGVIKNLDGINFVLAPLNASVKLSVDLNDLDTCEPIMVFDYNQMTGSEPCIPYRPKMTITLSSTSNCIDAGPGITIPLTCENVNHSKIQIPSSYYFNGISMPDGTICAGQARGYGTICPALYAAECLLIALLPRNLRYDIVREECNAFTGDCYTVTPPPPPATSKNLNLNKTLDNLTLVSTLGSSQIQTIFVKSGSVWTVPSNLDPIYAATIIGLGAGSGGGAGLPDAFLSGIAGIAGSGGAYSIIPSIFLNPGDNFMIQIGTAGLGSTTPGLYAGDNGGNTRFGIGLGVGSSDLLFAEGGHIDGGSNPIGGRASISIPLLNARSGGNGGNNNPFGHLGAPSGGGSAGPFGNGGNGVDTTTSGNGGAGAGAADNGGNGSVTSSGFGGQGGIARDLTAGGSGGADFGVNGGNGSHGSGGGGGGGGGLGDLLIAGSGGDGGSEIIWTQTSDGETAGPGGGGGGGGGGSGAPTGGAGGKGGGYGAGGGGGGCGSSSTGFGADGSPGILVITARFFV